MSFTFNIGNHQKTKTVVPTVKKSTPVVGISYDSNGIRVGSKPKSTKVETAKPKNAAKSKTSNNIFKTQLPYNQTFDSSASSPTLMQFDITQKNGADKASEKYIKENINKPVKSKLDRAIMGAIGSALDTATFGIYNKNLEKNYGKAATRYQTGGAKYAGMALGALADPLGLAGVGEKAALKVYSKLGGLGLKQAYRLGGKLASKAVGKEVAKKAAASATKNAIIGAGYSTANEAAQAAMGDKQSLGGRLKDIALGTAASAALGTALEGAGRGIKLRGEYKGKTGVFEPQTTTQKAKGLFGSKESNVTLDSANNSKLSYAEASRSTKPTTSQVTEGKLNSNQIGVDKNRNIVYGLKNAEKTYTLPGQKSGDYKPVRFDKGRQGQLEEALQSTFRIAEKSGLDMKTDLPKIKEIFKMFAPKKGDHFTKAVEELSNYNARQGVKLTQSQLQKAMARGSKQRDWRSVVGLEPIGKAVPPSASKMKAPTTSKNVANLEAPTNTPNVAEPVMNISPEQPSLVRVKPEKVKGTKGKGKQQVKKPIAQTTETPVTTEKPMKSEAKAPTTKDKLGEEAGKIANSVDAKALKGFVFDPYKSNDLYRVVERVFKSSGGKDNIVSKEYMGNFDKAKGKWFDAQAEEANWLHKLTKDTKIAKGSKESAAVQDFGEGVISEDKLKELFPTKWVAIKAAAKAFEAKYKQAIKDVNDEIRRVYGPDSGREIEPRQDYFHHIREMSPKSVLDKLKSFFAGNELNTEGNKFVRGTLKKFGYMKERKNGPYKSDAIGSFENYIPQFTYTKTMTEQAVKFDELAKAFKAKGEATGDEAFTKIGQTFENAATQLGSFGSKEESILTGGAKKTLEGASNLVKKNVFLANLSATIGQLGNLPQGIARAGFTNTASGLAGMFKKEMKDAFAQSSFLKERFSHKIYGKLNTRIVEQPQKFAEFLIGATDEIGTKLIFSGLYKKALKEGIENPIEYAGRETRKLVGGRGLLEMPPNQQNAFIKHLAPFTYEMANTWKILGENVSEGKATEIIKFMIASYLLNEVARQVRGSGIGFDPINAFKDAFGSDLPIPDEVKKILGIDERKKDTTEKVGRLAGEVVSNIPFGGYLADTLIPQTGIKIKGKTYTRKDLFGQQDPTRYGSNPLVAEPLIKSGQDLFNGNTKGALGTLATNYVTPFGGSQLKKTTEGILALKRGGKYKDGKLSYPVEATPLNAAKALVFGPSQTKEGQAFFDSSRNIPQPLGIHKTKAVNMIGDKQKGFRMAMNLRVLNNNKATDADKMKAQKAFYKDFNTLDKQMQSAFLNEYYTPDKKK